MRFNWERTNPEICYRLDFFLMSESLCPNVLEPEIHPGYGISETECKISQYADDTTLILDGTAWQDGKRVHCKYPSVVPYKALEKFSKALYGTT